MFQVSRYIHEIYEKYFKMLIFLCYHRNHFNICIDFEWTNIFFSIKFINIRFRWIKFL